MEWAVGPGLAVVKVALRLYGKADVADLVDDIVGGSEGLVHSRRRLGPPDLGNLIADRIEAVLPRASRARLKADPESRAAGPAADVIAGFAGDPRALMTALARPDDFPAWVRAHGDTQQLVATVREPSTARS